MDAVVHLAALPGVRAHRSPSLLRAVNVDLAGRLARAAARSGARFVFTSSSSVYGSASVLPTPEDAPPGPLNAYAETKVAAEAAVLAAGGDPVVVRPFTRLRPRPAARHGLRPLDPRARVRPAAAVARAARHRA